MFAWVAVRRRLVEGKRSLLPVLLFAGFTLTACAGENVDGDVARGRQLFTSLPCAGCHGALAQGGFGPALAGTDLTYREVQRQVRAPRDLMPSFDRTAVSDRDLHHIYAWLASLPAATPTPPVTLSPPEATAAARDRFYPRFDAADMLAQIDNLEEAALRIQGTVVSVEEEGRFSEVVVTMTQERTSATVLVLYDTALARQPFPAAVGDRATFYGVGADPVEIRSGGEAQKVPRIQALEVVVH